MKYKLTAAQWVIIILGIGLILSLGWNAYFYNRIYGPLPPMRGTYCTNASASRGTYLIFDGEGRFCRYTQEEGVLDDGTCEEIGENRYALVSDAGRTFGILRNREGVYLFDGEENYISFFPKLKSGTAYFLAGGAEWPEWVNSPA